MSIYLLKYILKYWAVIILLLLVSIFFYPVLIQGKTFLAFDVLYKYLPWSSLSPKIESNNLLISDPVNFFYPIYHFYQNSIKGGAVPLWNNLTFCGIPFTPFSIYPYLYYSFFPILTAHDLLIFIHIFFAGFFNYLYLQKLRLAKIPSLIGAIAWMFNGYLSVWLEFEYTIMMAITLPAVLYFIESWYDKLNRKDLLGLVFFISLMFAIGYAHLVILQLLFILAYLIYKTIIDIKNNNKLIARKIIGVMIAGLISILISTNFITSHLSLYRGNQRKPISPKKLFEIKGKLPPHYLITLIYPNFFGNPAKKTYLMPKKYTTQRYNNYNEICIYCGIVPLFFAFCSFIFIRKRKDIVFFMFVAAVSLLMAMGSTLYYPLLKFIPGLNLSTPTRILYIFGFSISILAGIGADILYEERIHVKKRLSSVCIVLVFVALAACLIMQSDLGIKFIFGDVSINDLALLRYFYFMPSEVFTESLILIFTTFIMFLGIILSKRSIHKIIFFLLITITLSYDLLSFSSNYNTASPKYMEYPSTPAIKFLKRDSSKYRIMTFGNFLHNGFAPFGIEDIGGYSSFYPRRYGEYLHLSQNKSVLSLPYDFSRWTRFNYFGSALLDLINTKYILLPPDAHIKINTLKLVYDNEIKIYLNLKAFPRIFFVPKYRIVKNSKEALNHINKFNRKDFKKIVIIERPHHFPSNNSTIIANKKDVKIDIISYQPNRIEFNVQSNSSGFIVISDNYHPGWRAKINGDDVNIFRANYIMRAVQIKSGESNIVLSFIPTFIISGFAISIIGWAVLIILILITLIQKMCYSFKNL